MLSIAKMAWSMCCKFTLLKNLKHTIPIIHNSRGKKIYRKFPKEGNDLDEEESVGSDPDDVRPLTRSSIKPRLLFPSQKQTKEREVANIDDEEALTDIEDIQRPDFEEEHVSTPVKRTVFSPPTPPTTGHATRSSTKQAPEPVEAIPYKGKKTSPFDGWARKKAGTDTNSRPEAKGRKREGEALERDSLAGGSKKFKGNSVT